MKQNFTGDFIGTKTGSPYDKFKSSTKLLFILDRILLNEMAEDKALNNYKAIIIDEAHERNINSDVLIGLILQACKLRPDLKIIITSATLDEKLFKKYFNTKILFVSGRAFPVEVRY